jgi:hypothetical protein
MLKAHERISQSSGWMRIAAIATAAAKRAVPLRPGFMRRGDAYAAYWMHWTAAHLADTGANLDLVLGKWGEGTGPAIVSPSPSCIASNRTELPALMVIDAQGRPAATATLRPLVCVAKM